MVLQLLFAGVESELRSLHTQEAALDAKKEDLKEKEAAVAPLEEHNCGLQRMIAELQEVMRNVEGKITSLKAKDKFLSSLEGVAKSRNARLAMKEDLILTRLARTLEAMNHFEPLCPPERIPRDATAEWKEVREDQVSVQVWEGSKGHWVEIGRRVFYINFASGEVWLRLQ